MKTLVSIVGIAGLIAIGAAFTGPQERQPVSSPAVASEKSGDENGCSGCFCCFPRTPDGNVSVQGFVSTASEVVYKVPHDKWFLATDIEVVALDAQGMPVWQHRVGLFEDDSMGMHGGMKMMKRWANCSPYHSARGIPFMPMCDVLLEPLSSAAANTKATQVYYQINGYLWDDAGGSSHSH